jgi:GTP-binding protein
MPPRRVTKRADEAKLPMKKHAIVAESPRAAKAAAAAHVPGPLEGATFVTGAAAASQLPAPGAPEIAFAGRSNAGKSSAINALARRTRLAHASRTPGRTRQINFYRLRGGAFDTDLPGYGYAAVSRELARTWQDFLWSYVTTRTTLIGLVVVIDARHGLKPLDMDVLGAFLPSGRPVLLLATKIDKLGVTDGRRAIAGIREGVHAAFPRNASAAAVVGFSATTRHGVGEADSVLAQWLGA